MTQHSFLKIRQKAHDLNANQTLTSYKVQHWKGASFEIDRIEALLSWVFMVNYHKSLTAHVTEQNGCVYILPASPCV